MTIANCIIFKNGKIIDRNVWVESRDYTDQNNTHKSFDPKYQRVAIFHSTFCEPTDPRDLLTFCDLEEISFIRPWSFDSPDLYRSFHHICQLALRDTKDRIFGNQISKYRCPGLES